MTAVDSITTAKICSKCGQEKSVSEFGKCERGLYGYRGDCKSCEQDVKKEYRKRESYKEYARNAAKSYYEANKERYKQYHKARYENAKKEKQPIELQKKQCKKCNLLFTPSHGLQKYCSDQCRITGIKERNIELSKTEGLTKVCFTCGIEKALSEYRSCYTAKYGVDNHCKECEKKKLRIETYGDDQTAKCEICGTEFEKGNNKKFCSDRCKRAARTVRNGGVPNPNRNPKPANPIIDGTRKCTKCHIVKPIDQYFFDVRFNKYFGKCNDCRKESVKVAVKLHKKKQKEKDPIAWRKIRQEESRKKAEKKGLKYTPRGPREPYDIERAYDRVIERNARDAFDWWFAKKSDKEVVAWYEASGEPWKNPRLTQGQAWSARYRVDSQFREHEKARLYLKKIKRKRKVIAESDGTVPFDLLEKAKSCLYCGIKFNDQCKPTLDHLIPLSKGGTHSAANAVVCCLSCNSSKGNRDFLKFVEKLIEPFKTQAINAWRKLRGTSPQQQPLIL
jgi:uncharacterized CHY-type Zn-finger protein